MKTLTKKTEEKTVLTVEANPLVLASIREVRRFVQARKFCKDKEDKAKDAFLLIVGEKEQVINSNGKKIASVSLGKSVSVDMDKLKTNPKRLATYQAILADFKKETPFCKINLH